MTDRLFLDTSGWFAAVSPREARHREARQAYSAAVAAGAVVTTGLVVAEIHTLLLRFRGPARAVEFLEALESDRSHEVVEVDRELRQAAVGRWLLGFPDQAFSLTDAVSFEVMRRRKLRRALALDRHFAAAGYVMVP